METSCSGRSVHTAALRHSPRPLSASSHFLPLISPHFPQNLPPHALPPEKRLQASFNLASGKIQTQPVVPSISNLLNRLFTLYPISYFSHAPSPINEKENSLRRLYPPLLSPLPGTLTPAPPHHHHWHFLLLLESLPPYQSLRKCSLWGGDDTAHVHFVVATCISPLLSCIITQLYNHNQELLACFFFFFISIATLIPRHSRHPRVGGGGASVAKHKEWMS